MDAYTHVMLNFFLIVIFISTMAKVYSKDSIKLPFNIDACICNRLGGLICKKECEAMVCRTE